MAGESLATCQLDDGWVCYGCGETFDGIAPWGMYCPAPLCREAYKAEFGEPYMARVSITTPPQSTMR